jgi:Ca-activated chloride channel family protein
LWARKKIAELDDYNTLFNEDVMDRVIALGLKYNLATKYTSFVAVDESIVNKGGNSKTVKQPLPMPLNVNNSAVGAEAEVHVKTRFKTSYVIAFDNEILKTEKRRIKMEFKALYSKLVQDYLEKHQSLRVSFDAKGAILSVEINKNGIWVNDKTITKKFNAFSKGISHISKEMKLTITK